MKIILICLIVGLILTYGIRRRYRRVVSARRLSVLKQSPLTIAAPVVILLSWHRLLAGHYYWLFIASCAALALGVWLAYLNLARTKFEQKDAKITFKPHRTIGLALFGVLMAQLLIEIIVISIGIRPHWSQLVQEFRQLPASEQESPAGVVHVFLENPPVAHIRHFFDPITITVIMLLAGYHFWYHLNLMIRGWRMQTGPKRRLL